jgi:hypothetical protein
MPMLQISHIHSSHSNEMYFIIYLLFCIIDLFILYTAKATSAAIPGATVKKRPYTGVD